MRAKNPCPGKIQMKAITRAFGLKKIYEAVSSLLQTKFQHSGISIYVDENCGSIDLVRPVNAFRNKMVSLQIAPDGSLLILSEGQCDQVQELSKKVAAEVLSRLDKTEIN